MTEIKHTPGPWKLDELLSEGNVPAPYDALDGKGWDYKKRWLKANDIIIAEVMAMQTGKFLHDFDQFEANCKLIAAAPELLEALQALMDYPEEDLNEWATGNIKSVTMTFTQPQILNAINAIKKATE